MLAQFKKIIVIGFTVVVFDTAIAQLTHDALNSLKSFQAVRNNPSDDAKQGVLRELLGTDGAPLQMPAFPRIWHQIEKGSAHETNTSYGINPTFSIKAGPISLGNIGAGVKTSINYSYMRRRYLVVMTSTRQTNRTGAVEQPVAANPLNDLNEITDFDPRTNRRFYKVRPNYPMVGFCAYEMTVKMAKSSEGSISFVVGSAADSNSEYQSESMTLYSNFFQIEANVPVNDYLDVKCGGDFLEEASRFVENDFNKIILEYYTLYHPSNNCRLESSSNPGGDMSCLGWFKENVDKVTQKMTVPRCEQQVNGSVKCVLKAKKEKSCPMYYGKNGSYTTQFSLYKEATLSNFGFPCDAGLSCSMDREPSLFWPGAASCK